MVESRGGLENLDRGLMVGHTVRQFELWWSQLHGDPIFEEHEAAITNSTFYPQPPFTEDIDAIVHQIPFGFRNIAQGGRFTKEMVVLLGRICYFERLGNVDEPLLRETLSSADGICQTAHNNFNEACPALSLPGTCLEKYLSYALLLYCNLTFSPKPALLEACNLIFAIPRFLLTRDLAAFEAKPTDEERCLVWIWLILIDSWIIANKFRSVASTALSLQLISKYPCCGDWTYVEGILKDFFASATVLGSLQDHWSGLRMRS